MLNLVKLALSQPSVNTFISSFVHIVIFQYIWECGQVGHQLQKVENSWVIQDLFVVSEIIALTVFKYVRLVVIFQFCPLKKDFSFFGIIGGK